MLSDKIKEVIQHQGKALNLHDKAELIRNLIFIHQVIVATENLMLTAAACASSELQSYFLEHYEEERGHADWLADDLRTAGVDVKKRPLDLLATQFVGTQYYLIQHIHPTALLGYMAVLEGSPMPIEQVEELEALHGKDLLRCLRFHAEHDVDHREELWKVIDSQPEHLHSVILNSAVQTARYLAQFTGQP